MKIRNKKTKEVLELGEDIYIESLWNGRLEVRKPLTAGFMYYYYDSLGKFLKEWEDAE